MAEKDIVAELQKSADVAHSDGRVGQADMLRRAIAEILRLRSLAGAVSAGAGDFQTIRNIAPQAHKGSWVGGDDAAVARSRLDDKPNTGC